MAILQSFEKFFSLKSTINSMFQNATLSNYFINKLMLWNQILSNNGQSMEPNNSINVRFNFNSSLKLLSKIRQSRETLSQIDWLSIGTATPDV